MRLLAVLGGGLIAAALVASCGTSSGSGAGSKATPAPSATAKQAYLEQVEKSYPAAASMSKDNLVKLGIVLCADLENGRSVQHEVAALTKGGASTELISAVLVAAPSYFCPSESAKVKRFIGIS